MSIRGFFCFSCLAGVALGACSSPRFFSDGEREKGGGGSGANGGEGTGASDGGAGEGTGGSSGENAGGTSSGGAATGGENTGGAQAGGGAGGSGGGAGGTTRGGTAGGGVGGAGGADPEPVDIRLVVEDDTDDAVWVIGTDERLAYSEQEPFVEVGADNEMARCGFRFVLPIPPGSTIESASLRLERRQGTAAPEETLAVQVFDSATVAPFDDGHEHAPQEHDPGGLFALAILGFAVGANDETIDSPDLASLVTRVIERSDYVEGGALGFVLSADDLAGWAMFSDSSSGDGASLAVRYVPP